MPSRRGSAKRWKHNFPTLNFSYATTGEEVLAKLETHDPEVVFSMKEPSFPGHLHRPVVDHPSVRWIQIGGSGYDHMLPWDESRITVTNGAGVLSRFLAETVTGAMLMLNGKFLRYQSHQRKHEWRPVGYRSLEGQALLVVGVGAIGGALAGNAKTLGMRVIGIRGSDTPHPSVDVMYKPEQLADVIGEADVLSLHVRLNEATHHLIDASSLGAMKAGALLINTSRGAVVDEQALAEALERGHVGGAYLDVFETEPLPAESPLWEMENVFITPHSSDAVTDWPERFGVHFADNLQRWCAGQPLDNLVSPT